MIMDPGFAGFAAFFGSRLRPSSLNQPEISVITVATASISLVQNSQKPQKPQNPTPEETNLQIVGPWSGTEQTTRQRRPRSARCRCSGSLRNLWSREMPVVLLPPTLAVPTWRLDGFFRRRETRRSMIANTIRVLDTVPTNLSPTLLPKKPLPALQRPARL
jgi:hypothetical protein